MRILGPNVLPGCSLRAAACVDSTSASVSVTVRFGAKPTTGTGRSRPLGGGSGRRLCSVPRILFTNSDVSVCHPQRPVSPSLADIGSDVVVILADRCSGSTHLRTAARKIGQSRSRRRTRAGRVASKPARRRMPGPTISISRLPFASTAEPGETAKGPGRSACRGRDRQPRPVARVQQIEVHQRRAFSTFEMDQKSVEHSRPPPAPYRPNPDEQQDKTASAEAAWIGPSSWRLRSRLPRRDIPVPSGVARR